MKLAILILVLAALTFLACRGLQRNRNWARAKEVTVDLNGVAEVRLPAELRLDSESIRHTGDRTTFQFRRVNDHHWNGMTSYAELMSVSLLAPDLPVSSSIDVEETLYERDPVREPSWKVRLSDPKTGVAIDWQGFQRHYTADQAKANILHIRDTLRWRHDRADHFQSHRDWSTENWQQVRGRNLQLLAEALAAKGFPPAGSTWTRHGNWRYIIDNDRPQRFHLVRHIASIELPDGPFGLLSPLTFFRYYHTRGFWHQENQGRGGGILPAAVLAEFQTELTNSRLVYFYRIQDLQLWKEHASLSDALHELIREGDLRAGEFEKQGAIDASAEP